MLAPGRADCDPAADPEHIEVLLPAVLPILFLHHSLLKRRYVRHMRHKTHPNVDPAAPLVQRFVHRQVGCNRRPLVARGRFTLIWIETTFLLHGHPAMPIAIENLRERFYKLRRSADAQLKPLQCLLTFLQFQNTKRTHCRAPKCVSCPCILTDNAIRLR